MNKRKTVIIIIIFISAILSSFFYFTRKSFSIPVLMYHYITNEESTQEVCVSKKRFEEQIKYLKDNGYKFLTIEELRKLRDSKKRFPRKSVVITFDDGYSDIYYNALPIMKRYGAKGTVFVISGKIGSPMYLNKDELRELQKSDIINIGSHTVNHKELDKLSFDDQLSELKESKETLESIIGSKVEHIAYPYGKYNRDTVKAAELAGYKMGFTVDGDYTRSEGGYYDLRRFWALSDFKYFKEVSKVSRASDLKYYIVKTVKR